MPFNDMKLEAEFKTWTKKYNINDPDNYMWPDKFKLKGHPIPPE